MSKVRVHPHRTATQEAVDFGAWWVWLNGERILAEDQLKGWDYEAETRFEIQPSFDERALVESTEISEIWALSIVALVDCAATNRRFTAAVSLADLVAAEDRSLFVDVPQGELADQVRLSAHLVLNSTLEPGNQGRATRPGSRLAESSVHSLRLEGDGARFPTEEVSFSSLHLEDAAWTLRCDFDDLDASFLGSVRLLVNSDHEAASLLLDNAETGSALAQSVLRFDVARQLFMTVVLDQHMEVSAQQDFDEGTVGHALASMAALYLHADLRTVIQLARTRFDDFERRMQAGFDLMRSV